MRYALVFLGSVSLSLAVSSVQISAQWGGDVHRPDRGERERDYGRNRREHDGYGDDWRDSARWDPRDRDRCDEDYQGRVDYGHKDLVDCDQFEDEARIAKKESDEFSTRGISSLESERREAQSIISRLQDRDVEADLEKVVRRNQETLNEGSRDNANDKAEADKVIAKANDQLSVAEDLDDQADEEERLAKKRDQQGKPGLAIAHRKSRDELRAQAKSKREDAAKNKAWAANHVRNRKRQENMDEATRRLNRAEDDLESIRAQRRDGTLENSLKRRDELDSRIRDIQQTKDRLKRSADRAQYAANACMEANCKAEAFDSMHWAVKNIRTEIDRLQRAGLDPAKSFEEGCKIKLYNRRQDSYCEWLGKKEAYRAICYALEP